ncbi:MAG: HAD family phosphatase [Sphingobacteriales bacterium]|nr:HAD family phosphatase [Sphingobacteriales bacterium]
MGNINTIIFDLGGVLIDWNPRYVYRTIFDSEEKVEWFLQHICTMDWNEKQDEGYPIAKAVEEKIAEFPEWEKEISAYYDRWAEMLGGSIDESVDLFRKLKEETGLKFYALTNWSAELFPIALERYDFLHWFHGRVVSGEEKTRKPFADIYQRLLKRYNVNAGEALFIDDSVRNVKGAEAVGIKTIHFQNPQQLGNELNKYLLL